MKAQTPPSSSEKTTAADKPVEILIVEDNPCDVRLTAEAFKVVGLANNMSAVADGVEAMAFLRRQGRYAGAPRPDIILLDLNLPKKDGREVLAEVKNDEELRNIPVIVFTGSKAQQDILGSYKLRANCFITKPVNMDQLIEAMKLVRDFWLTSKK